MGICVNVPHNKKLLAILSMSILLGVIYIIWSQRELYYSISSSNTNVLFYFDDFTSPNNSFPQTKSLFHRFIRKKSRKKIKNIHSNLPIKVKPKMSDIQSIINKFIEKLSSNNFDTFNEDILINKMTFKHLSFNFMFSAIYNKTIWFHGDSFCRKFWRYIVFVMHHKYYNNTSKMDIPSGEMGILKHLLNEENNITNLSLSMPEFNAHWLLTHEMEKIGVAKQDAYTISSEKENTWYTVFEKYFIKLILTAHTLHQNPFIYTAQFKHFNKYLSLQPKSSLDVLFINFQSLHLTHLLPDRKFEKYAIEMIKNLEKHFDKVIELAIGNYNVTYVRNTGNNSNQTKRINKQIKKVKCVIFRPPNPICRNVYKKSWIKLSEFFEDKILNMSDSEIRNHSKIIKCLNDHNINGDKIYYENNKTGIILRGVDICSKYSITQVGVEEINNRIKKYVFEKQNMLYDKYGIKLIYYDQMRLFTGYCNKTYDGRHYIELLPVETVAVFNIIEKWC